MFNRIKELLFGVTAEDVYGYALDINDSCDQLLERVELLEKHLGVEYFNGGKNKPHYRSKRTRKEK